MEVAARAEGAAVDARHADQLLAERSAESGLTLASIAKATARYYDVTLADMKSKSRRKAIVAARGMAVYLARERTGASLVSIGRFFGGRDHTTALHAYRSTRKRIAETSEAAQALAEVEALLGEG
jgi:chromosomal replication initiator protein